MTTPNPFGPGGEYTATQGRKGETALANRGKEPGGKPVGALNQSKNAADYVNPRFDPRIYTMFNPEGGAFFRGYMEQAPEYWRELGQPHPYRVNFLYNPSTIDVSYQVNNNLFPPQVWEAAATATSLVPNMQQIGFSLLFDRTYEVGSIMHPHKEMVGLGSRLAEGVRADVGALERMVGIMKGAGGILPVPVNLVFGLGMSHSDTEGSDRRNSRGMESRPGPQSMRFYGWISGMNVTYTHFSSNMTPTRAVVAINFSQFVRADQARVVDPELKSYNTAIDANAGTEVKDT